MDLTPEITADIAERLRELDETHALTPARREAAELVLLDLVQRGEWPPPEDSDGDGVTDEMEHALEELARTTAALEAASLELDRAKARGPTDTHATLQALSSALGWGPREYARARAALDG